MQLEARLRLCQRCLWCCKGGLRLFSQSHAHRKAANHYELLGIKSDANLEEIKKAFFDKSKKMHPDSDPSNPALHNQFVELSEAYRVLSKEQSRKEYDFKIKHQYSGGQAYSSTSGPNIYRASPSKNPHQDNSEYWEQFYQSQRADTTAEKERMKRKNLRLVGYCLVAMAVSIGFHIILFSKLEDIHTNFMDEKDRIITEIYNEAKERARVNGFKKQTEILRLKHAEFLEKYRNHRSGGDK